MAAVTLTAGDILVLQADLLMRVDPVTLGRTDYPAGILCVPGGLALVSAGNLYATSNPHQGCPEPEPGAHGVYHIDGSTGAQTEVASGGLLAGTLNGIVAGAAGELYVAVANAPAPGTVVQVSAMNGSQALVSAEFLSPYGLAREASGDLVVTDPGDNAVYRLTPSSGVRTLLSQDGWLRGLYQAGGIAVGPAGDIYVATIDVDAEDETGVIVRLDPSTGAQTVLSYGQLLVASNTGVTGIAVEADGSLLVTDRRSAFGIIRINAGTGTQTGLDIGASPIHGIAVVPPAGPVVDVPGLLAPYAPPGERAFKRGSVIPLRWQFTLGGAVINSAAYPATPTAEGPIGCVTGGSGTIVTATAPGNSGLRYDSATDTWEYNWKTTKGMAAGCYRVTIAQATLGVTRSFLVEVAP